ncbi:MAG: Ryanodine receptor Ryr [Muribaculaceae bacterium]|nr:Ryanodine receptor Ryr [Muribaculaceae bacterium]
MDVSDILLDAELEELTEAIAENAHDVWARARMDEGWTYGPVRDDARKLHPDLVPYAKLPETEKEYDRIMAMNTLRLVRRLGFDIIPRT